MQWHTIRDPRDPELDRLATRYHLHPLHVEDCRHRNQSAKVEENPNYIFVVLKPVQIGPDQQLQAADLDVFVGRDFVITVEEAECRTMKGMIDQMLPAAERLRPDQVLYRIADSLVDSYLPILDRYAEVIDDLEDVVLEAPTPAALSRIFELKRNLIVLRRILVNTRDVAGHLLRFESEFLERDLSPFFRDVYDHVARSLDMVEMLRDLLTGALDVYLSSVANRTNNVMKVLTVVGTIALPVLVISGVYGMNIQGLPWAESPHAILAVTALITAATVSLLLILRLRNWF